MSTEGSNRAFPMLGPEGPLAEGTFYNPGLSKRQYYAALAMIGILAGSLGGSAIGEAEKNMRIRAAACWLYADALLAAENEEAKP